MRKETGRAPIFDETMTERIMVRLPAKTRKRLEAIAAEEEINLGAVARKMIHQQLALRKPRRNSRRAA